AGGGGGRGGAGDGDGRAGGVIASSAIRGQTMAVAVGSALAFKLDGSERVAATFFGDGTVEEGIFHESVNFAAVKGLPVIFVCENNGYSTHTPLPVRQPHEVSIHPPAPSSAIPPKPFAANHAL